MATHKTSPDPQEYLGRTFQHPIILLAAMFETGAVLSGSRALEFFVKGSVDNSSDWDFFVPGYHTSMATMVGALSSCGVQWPDLVSKIEHKWRQQEKVVLSRQNLDYLAEWLDFERKSPLGDLTDSLIKESMSKPWQSVYTFSSTLKGPELQLQPFPLDQGSHSRSAQNDDYTDNSGNRFEMLTGVVKLKDGREQKVQLIIGRYYDHIKTALSMILGFHASHVQCFIGGHFAAHLYPCPDRKAILWKDPDERIARAVEKYERRGFEFRKPPLEISDNPKRNIANDSRTILQKYDPHF